MTREEAIENLKWLLECSYVDSFEDAENEALRMAIKALEYDDAKYHEEHGEVIVDKAVWEDAKKALEQQSMPTMVYPQVEGITPVVVEPIPKLPPVNQQEPCGDLISRRAALVSIRTLYPGIPLIGKSAIGKSARRKWEDEYAPYFECENAIEQLPPVKPQKPKWIPVSERLPEKNVWVLVTVEQSGNRYQEMMRRNNYIEAWTDNIDNYTDEIIAWMPLPEPYKAESEDKK